MNNYNSDYLTRPREHKFNILDPFGVENQEEEEEEYNQVHQIQVNHSREFSNRSINHFNSLDINYNLNGLSVLQGLQAKYNYKINSNLSHGIIPSEKLIQRRNLLALIENDYHLLLNYNNSYHGIKNSAVNYHVKINLLKNLESLKATFMKGVHFYY